MAKQEIPTISNPKDLEEFRKGVEEITASMARQQAEKELVSSIKSKLKENIGMPGAETGRIATIRFKENLKEIEAKADTTISLYEQTFGERS